MLGEIRDLLQLGKETVRDVAPVVLVITLFQFFIIGEPLPDLADRMVGLVLILIGLTLFVRGLIMSIFPLGDSLAQALAQRGSLVFLLAFAFGVGVASTVAEPALAAVTEQAAEAAVIAGFLPETEIQSYARILRYASALAVGAAVTLGVLRTVLGWPIAWFVLGGYGLAALLAMTGTPLASVAFDAGAAATSAINIPLITALGLGLASMIRGRSALVDGLGTVALASLMPMLTILAGSLLLGGVAR